jgi:hypothetical protein
MLRVIVLCLIADVTRRRQLNSSVHEIRHELELPGLHQNEGTSYAYV